MGACQPGDVLGLAEQFAVPTKITYAADWTRYHDHTKKVFLLVSPAVHVPKDQEFSEKQHLQQTIQLASNHAGAVNFLPANAFVVHAWGHGHNFRNVKELWKYRGQEEKVRLLRRQSAQTILVTWLVRVSVLSTWF